MALCLKVKSHAIATKEQKQKQTETQVRLGGWLRDTPVLQVSAWRLYSPQGQAGLGSLTSHRLRSQDKG